MLFSRWLAALALLLSGCGAPTGRVAFSGRVTAGDRPIPLGTISFLPAEAHPGGPAANTSIEAGVYRFTAEDGPVPGPHRVLINVLGGSSKAARSTTSEVPPRREFEVTVTDQLDFRADFQLDTP